MPSKPNSIRRFAAPAAALPAGLAIAVVLAGIAIARTPTLQIARNATVTSASGGNQHEAIVVNGRDRAVYALTGDSRRHPECTHANGCFAVWAPVTVGAHAPLAKAAGIHGGLSRWRHAGVTQLVLGGHPLYTYVGDSARASATGEGIMSFHGTWHVIVTGGSSMSHGTGTTPTTPTTTMPAPCVYPPCY